VSDKSIVAAWADTHFGHIVSLMPPVIALTDGGSRRANRIQTWIAARWGEFWDEAEDWARREKATECWSLFFGDLYEGDHFGTKSLWSSKLPDWNRAAHSCLERPLAWADLSFWVRGTHAHAGRDADLEETWAQDITTAVPEPITERSTWGYLDIEVAGVRIQGMHRGPMGRLPHTRGNALNGMSYRVDRRAHRSGEKPPDIFFQAHNHIYDESSPSCPVRVIALPAWKAICGYAENIGIIEDADIGGVLLLCQDGEVRKVKVMKDRVRRRRAWRRPPKTS